MAASRSFARCTCSESGGQIDLVHRPWRPLVRAPRSVGLRSHVLDAVQADGPVVPDSFGERGRRAGIDPCVGQGHVQYLCGTIHVRLRKLARDLNQDVVVRLAEQGMGDLVLEALLAPVAKRIFSGLAASLSTSRLNPRRISASRRPAALVRTRASVLRSRASATSFARSRGDRPFCAIPSGVSSPAASHCLFLIASASTGSTNNGITSTDSRRS